MPQVQTSTPVALLRLVHLRPGISRAAAARSLGMASGLAAETTARLVAARLVLEAPAPPSGQRGRPTTSLLPHPEGPLVAVVSVSHETWQVAVVQVGGKVVTSAGATHRRSLPHVRRSIGTRLQAVHERFGDRVGAYVVAVPGTVTGTRLVQAAVLGWRDVELAALRPSAARATLLAGNDATFAGVAEGRRGAAEGAGSSVHLYFDAGVGGAHLLAGRPVLGATGSAGEFGHMPFGDPSHLCPCGARGCWNTSLDGEAIAALLHDERPADQVSFTRQVIAAARSGGRAEQRALKVVASSLGRGAAGLVNALDPEIVTVGGLGRPLLELMAAEVRDAYEGGLMAFRAAAPPPVVPGRFGDDAPVVGAADEGFATLLTDDGIRLWAERR